MDDKNDSGSRVEISKCYEKLRAADDMNNSMLRDQGSRLYEQLRAMDDMKDLGSHESRVLDVVNNSGL